LCGIVEAEWQRTRTVSQWQFLVASRFWAFGPLDDLSDLPAFQTPVFDLLYHAGGSILCGSRQSSTPFGSWKFRALNAIGEQKEKHDKLSLVDESRKRVIGVMAAILAARKLAQYDGGRRVPATVAAISDAVRWAEEIMNEIDRRWPSRAR
jgi:hypothetical protein